MRRVFLISLIVITGVMLFSYPPEPATAVYETGKEFGIGTEGLIIELPEQGVYQVNQKSETVWDITSDLNMILVGPPNKRKSDLTLEIKNSKYPEKLFFIHLKVKNVDYQMVKIKDLSEIVQEDLVKEEKIVEEIPKEEQKAEEEAEKIEAVKEPGTESPAIKRLIEKQLALNEKLKTADEIEIKEREEKLESEETESPAEEGKKKEFDLETFFSLAGGTQSFEESGFAMEGELIVAGKAESGIFFQGAGKVIINEMINQYGFSVGAGFEPGKMGFFLFADTLMHKAGDEFDSTTHFQIRPSFRYRLSEKIHVAAFFALPIGAWQYTGVEVPGEPGIGYYNKSLLHGGLDLSLYLEKIFVDLRALFAEGGAFGVDLKAGYEVIRNIYLTLNYMYQNAGDYTYIDSISNTNRMGIGVTYSKRGSSAQEKGRIIFRPDYPMIVVAQKEVPEGEDSGEPAIVLTGDPVTGYAPLNVSYQAKPTGFDNSSLEMTWYFNTAYSAKSNNDSSQFIYNLPGTYQAWVEGEDGKGKKAKSNIVTITVLKNDGTAVFKIDSSCGPNGYIQPSGEVFANPGANVSISFEGNEGFGVSKITVDGVDQSSLSSPWVFSNVQKDHTIYVEFAEGAVPQYQIVASVKAGQGSVDPAGTTTVAQGSDQSYSITPASGWNISRVLVDGESVGAPVNYTFNNITESHTIEAEFSEIPPTLYEITASSGDGGSISPSGTNSVVEADDITFSISPDAGYEIDVLTVDGKTTSPNVGSDQYKFTNVQEPHSISVTFKRIVLNVTTSVIGEGGTITGSTTVFWGDSLTVTAAPNSSHQVKEMIVNGGSIGKTETVTLNSIKSNQTVSVEFEIKKYMIYASVRGTMGTISPGTSEVEHGSSITFNFVPMDGYHQAIRYWINGTLYNQKGASQYTFSNVTEEKTIEVEFDWKYFDIRVRLILVDNKAAGSVDPGTGTFTERAGTDHTFNFIPATGNQVQKVIVNGNNKGSLSSFKIYDLSQDEYIDVYIERKPIPLTVSNVGGCGVNVTCSNGQSGINKEYTILYGDDVTFYFDPHDEVTYDWWWSIDGALAQPMGSQHTFYNVTGSHNIRVKCVLAGQPKPEF